jgi:hypothetical protein
VVLQEGGPGPRCLAQGESQLRCVGALVALHQESTVVVHLQEELLPKSKVCLFQSWL